MYLPGFNDSPTANCKLEVGDLVDNLRIPNSQLLAEVGSWGFSSQGWELMIFETPTPNYQQKLGVGVFNFEDIRFDSDHKTNRTEIIVFLSNQNCSLATEVFP